MRDPVPVYPHSMIWRSGNPHPALGALRGYLGTVHAAAGTWTPAWAQRPAASQDRPFRQAPD